MDILENEQWLKLKARAESGDSDAQWEAGYYFENGAENSSGEIVVEPDTKSALHFYLRSAEQGNVLSQDTLVVFLSNGEGIPVDNKAALYWGRKAIKQGSGMAAHNTGLIYRDLNKPKLAFSYYQKGAQMGQSDALLEIGLCYLFGFGVQQDREAARLSLEQLIAGDPASSCQRSKENARYWLAVMRLLNPDGKSSRIGKARELLETANADDDHEQANELLNLIGKTRYRAKLKK